MEFTFQVEIRTHRTVLPARLEEVSKMRSSKEKGLVGEVEYETDGRTPFSSSQNPIPVWAPGTEWCVTKPIDWKAKKPGSPGYVP
jgi:hypothetical protein